MSDLLLTLGKDAAGSPVSFDLTRLPHLLIGGVTGSGKTMLIESLLSQLPVDVRILRPDPTKADETLATLRTAAEELNRRMALFDAANVRQINKYTPPLPRMVIVLDEYSPLMRTCREDAEQLLVHLAQLGRRTGIHLFLSSQRTQPEVLTGLMKANFPHRIAFRTATAQHSYSLLDCTGAEKLARPGDMLFLPLGAEAPIFVHCTAE